MQNRTVVVADPIHSFGLERLRARYRVLFLPDIQSEKAKIEAIADAEAMVVRLFEVRNPIFDQAPRLRLIAKHGSGVDNIDVPAATQRGVLVANTPGGSNATAVAEGAVTLMLAVLRRVRDMDRCVRENRFDERWRVSLHELWGRTVGIVGYGQIARHVARICGAGFNCKVICFDPFVGEAEMATSNVTKVDDLRKLAAQSDVLTVHVPLSAKTRHIVGADVIKAMSPNAILVNTSRGGTVDEAALVDALRHNRIAGAGIDVFEQEPPPADNPLFALDNVVLSPHVAGVTDDGLKGMATNVADLIDTVFSGQRPKTLLNDSIWENWKL